MIGAVAFYRYWDDRTGTLEECEAEWERTLETIRLEQMAGDTPPMQSRPFTEQSRPGCNIGVDDERDKV